MLQKLPPLQRGLSGSSGIREKPGPVVRQSVMEKTGGNFSGINGQFDRVGDWGVLRGGAELLSY